MNLSFLHSQQFVFLAYSFLRGHLNFIILPESIVDLSVFEGQYYWPLGPLPALLLLPFVAVFKLNFLQGFVQIPLNILNFILVFKICKTAGLERNKALALAVFFIFGSIYAPVGAIPVSWYFAQVVATTALLLAIYEFLSKKRPFVLGILVSVAVLTRISLIFAALFFLSSQLKKRAYFAFTIPIFIAVILLLAYNYARFKSPLESGYKCQILPEESALRRKIGLFSPKHIPANIYYMLVKGPDPVFKDNSHVLKFPYIRFDDYGASIFLLSPVLFLLFFIKKTDPYLKPALITSILIASVSVFYYGIGIKQIGYRYALDFFPFLFLMLIPPAKRISLKILMLLIIPGVLITWLFIFERFYNF